MRSVYTNIQALFLLWLCPVPLVVVGLLFVHHIVHVSLLRCVLSKGETRSRTSLFCGPSASYALSNCAQPMPQASGMQGPRLFVVNSQNEEAAPRALGLLSRLQLQPSAGAVQVCVSSCAVPDPTHPLVLAFSITGWRSKSTEERT